MRVRRLLWTMIAAGSLACAQESTEKIVPKIIPVHYVNVDHLRDLVNIPGVQVKADREMRVLVVSGRPDAISAIEEMVKKLDVAPPTPTVANFELTGYLVSGSSQARAEDLPADLAGTAKQLHALFPYKSYHVMDTFVMRGAERREFNGNDNGSSSGILPGTNSEYTFGYYRSIVSAGTPRSVHLENLSLSVSTPTVNRDKEGRIINRSVGIRTSVDIPEGQKVVVGKSNFTGGDDALILVLTARVIQ